jgi:hypothetical protein
LAEIIAPGRLAGSRDVDASPTPFLPTFVAQLEDAAYALGAYPKFGAQYGYHACGGRLLVFDPVSMTEVGLLPAAPPSSRAAAGATPRSSRNRRTTSPSSTSPIRRTWSGSGSAATPRS